MTVGNKFKPARLSVNPAPTMPVRDDVNRSCRCNNAAICTGIEGGTGLFPGCRTMPQHHPHALPFEMTDRLQCPSFPGQGDDA